MLRKAAALFLVCFSMAMWVGCSTTTSSDFMYAAVPSSSEIVAFREDPNSGVLTQLATSPITAGEAVQSVVIHPSKKFLYAANSGSNSVSLYTISSQGSLTEVTPRATTGSVPTLLAMDTAGAYLYVANSGSNDVSVFKIDASTGVLTSVAQFQGTTGTTAGVGTSPLNMVLSPSGSFLYITGQGAPNGSGFVEAFPITKGVLGAPVTGSPFLTGADPFGLAIDSGGKFLYTANKTDGTGTISEFSINANGSLTQLAGSPIGQSFTSPVSLLIDHSGKYLYVANQGSSNLTGFSIGSSGGLTLLTGSPFGTASNPSFIGTDASGKYLFVGNQGSTSSVESFSLDTSTGTLTEVATYTVPGTATSIAGTP